jgi:heme O synthase-like polyprenyltransferase
VKQGAGVARPAFYALSPGSWRDYWTLLHPPYTAWHLSYVVIGACLAPHLYTDRLLAALAAFFLALGVGAHALDELQDRPLATRISDRTLLVLTVAALGGAVAIGIAGAVSFNGWLLLFVAAGALLVPTYNLELFGGAIHNAPGFALAWGAFPLLTGYFACAGTIGWVALLAAAFAALTSYVQRVLSTPVRHLRRRVAAVSGALELRDGTSEPLTADHLFATQELSLQLLAAAHVCLAAALIVLRLA